MILQLKTDNPKLSYIINKNPQSGMVIRHLRKGLLYGWYNNDNYNMYFKDTFDDVSYKQNENVEFEYLDNTRYSSAMCILNIIDELLRETYKK